MTKPDAGGRVGRSEAAFVGREAELSSLVQALERSPALVLVEGDAGIGKSRLVRECLQAPALGGLRAMRLECPPLADPFPLGPVVDALHAQPLSSLDLSPLAGALRPLLPEWAHLLPPAPEPLDDPKAVRHRLFRATADLIERLGIDLLVVEDAHWADSSTLELLLMLAASPVTDLRILLTYRPPDLEPGSLLLRLTSRPSSQASQTRVELGPLDVEASRQLVVGLFETDQVSSSFV
ncbi:MAG: AAA family ATPase, partial [Nocardioidaceae bacterium]